MNDPSSAERGGTSGVPPFSKSLGFVNVCICTFLCWHGISRLFWFIKTKLQTVDKKKYFTTFTAF